MSVQNAVAAGSDSPDNESLRFIVEERIASIARELDMKKSVIATGMILGGLASFVIVDFPFGSFGLDAQAAQRKAESKRSGSKNSKSKKPINSKALDVRLEKAEELFIRETLDVAQQFEDAGRLEKSIRLYQSVLKIRPEFTKVQDRIKTIEETLLSSNEHEFVIDVTQGWGQPRARVFKERVVRIQASGTYRFILNQQLGPDGFSTENPEKGSMAAGVPAGALMGMIVSKNRAGKPKPGIPFEIGASSEFAPPSSGLLFLRVNHPSGHKCNGKIIVTLSGYVRAG
jgi:hypothetical protein